MKMKTTCLALFAALGLASSAVQAGSESRPAALGADRRFAASPPTPQASLQAAGPAAPAALDRFKALAGDWVAAADGPFFKKGDVVARYAVTANGSAVVETVFPGSAHEMVTVYHADGSDLVLTHFCMEGNQPRMRAKAPSGDHVEFNYDGGTNIDPRRDRHMHAATFEFLGPDAVRSRWTELSAGKTDFVADMNIVRKEK